MRQVRGRAVKQARMHKAHIATLLALRIAEAIYLALKANMYAVKDAAMVILIAAPKPQ